MLYTLIGIIIGLVFICLIPKFMEWSDYSPKDWKNKNKCPSIEFMIDQGGYYALKLRDIVSGDFVIPDGVRVIGESAFVSCDKLTSIIIPNSTTLICKGAFWGCKNLTSVIIPNSVREIGDNAFGFCPDLTVYVQNEKQAEMVRKSCFNYLNARSPLPLGGG